MKLIKSISGIRGIYKKTLNPDHITKYGYAFSKIQKNHSLPILVARDSRQSGLEIQTILIDFLNKIGRDVINCDIIPTPTAQLISDKFNIAGSIVITASHNPEEWNGLKFIDNDGTFLNVDKNKKLLEIADSTNELNINCDDKKGSSSNFIESIDLHINDVLAWLKKNQ